MGKWYNKIFVGNPNKPDFTAKDLPNTRVEQFFDVVKLHFSDMIVGNLVYALFSLPLLLWTLYYWFAMAQTDPEALQNALSGGDSWLWFYLIVAIPLYAIMGPAKAGLHYCIRNWVWNQRATVRDHFWKEFKRSFWKALFLNLFNGMFLFAGLWWVLSLNVETYPALRILAVFIGILMVTYFISSIYHFPQLVTYDLKITQIFKNSFIYTVAQLPRTLLAIIIYVALAAVCAALYQVLLVVAMSMGMSFVFLGQTVYSNFLFDKYVNAPEDRRRGMAPLDKK